MSSSRSLHFDIDPVDSLSQDSWWETATENADKLLKRGARRITLPVAALTAYIDVDRWNQRQRLQGEILGRYQQQMTPVLFEHPSHGFLIELRPPYATVGDASMVGSGPSVQDVMSNDEFADERWEGSEYYWVTGTVTSDESGDEETSAPNE
jgi:hypothetical protein